MTPEDYALFQQSVLGNTPSIAAPNTPAPIDMGDVDAPGFVPAPPRGPNAAERFASIINNPVGAALGPQRSNNLIDAGAAIATHPSFGFVTGTGRITSPLQSAASASGLQPVRLGEKPGAGLSDLSQRTQTTMGFDPVPPKLALNPDGSMNTPLANVNAAPTLNPAYGQLPQVSLGGGGGGSGSNSLKDKVDASNQERLRTMAERVSLSKDQGNAEAARIDAVAARELEDAERKRRDAEDQITVDRQAAEKHQAFLQRNVELANDIARQQPDPARFLRNASDATHFTIGLGAALGGGNAMLNGNNGNTSLDRLDKLIDKDISAQIEGFNSQRQSLNARTGLFNQMMTETGDERIAAQATRALMYESMKVKLNADAARLGLPEVKVKAQLATNEIDQKLKDLHAQMAGDAYKAFLAQAAAAAAARRAAEEREWQRKKDIFEMGHKTDMLKADVYKAELTAGKDKHKEDDAAITETTKRLGDDDIVKNRELINSLNRKVGKDGEIVGLSKTDQFRRALQPGSGGTVSTLAGGLNPIAHGINAVAGLNEEERNANKEWEQAKLLYQTKVTGTGGSDAQMQAIGRAFDGANTMSEKRHAINMLKSELDRREGLAYANLSDEQKVEVNRRMAREGQTAMPETVKVKK